MTVVTNPSSATCTLSYTINGNTRTVSSKTVSVPEGTTVTAYISDSTYGTASQSVVVDTNKTLTFTGASASYKLDSDLSKVGTLDITSSGQASGFTISNYLCTTKNASTVMSTGADLTLYLKFKFSALSGIQTLFSNNVLSDNALYGVHIYTVDETLYVKVGNSYATLIGSGILNEETWYYLTFTYMAGNDGNYYFVCRLASDNAIEFHTNGSFRMRDFAWTTHPLYFGVRRSGSNITYPATYATIDLYESYLNSSGDSFAIDNKGTSYYWEVVQS